MSYYAMYGAGTILILIIIFIMFTEKPSMLLKDPLGIKELGGKIDSKASVLQELLHTNNQHISELQKGIVRYEELYKEYKFSKYVEKAFAESTPDMYWVKDTEGKYIIANRSIRDRLLFDDRPIGKLDVDMAKARKAAIGDKNHTFGEVCGNSDLVVLQKKKPCRFVEYGKVSGKMLVLEVFKNVIRDEDGRIIGTLGIGRDITENYLELTRIAETTTDDEAKESLEKLLAKYKFENKDV